MAFTSMRGGVIAQGEAEGNNPVPSACKSSHNLYHGHMTCGQEEHAILICNSFHARDTRWIPMTSFSPRPRDLEGKGQTTT